MKYTDFLQALESRREDDRGDPRLLFSVLVSDEGCMIHPVAGIIKHGRELLLTCAYFYNDVVKQPEQYPGLEPLGNATFKTLDALVGKVDNVKVVFATDDGDSLIAEELRSIEPQEASVYDFEICVYAGRCEDAKEHYKAKPQEAAEIELAGETGSLTIEYAVGQMQQRKTERQGCARDWFYNVF